MLDFDQVIQDRYVYNVKTGKKYFNNFDVLNSNEKYNDLRYTIDGNQWYKFNWLEEPSESFESLLMERCKQLRDKYPYLVLYYSGGSDSETVLQSFIKANIHLDEIVTNVFKINDDDPPLLDVELAIMKLKEVYKPHIPKTKITINNLSRDMFLEFNQKQTWADSSFNGTLGHFRRMPLPVAQELGQKVKINSSNIGHIFAEAKPHLRKKEDGYYAIWGVPLTVASHWAEWFFTSLDLPKLHLKQCHLAKNYFKNFNPQETTIVEVGAVREQLIRSCRYLFDNRFQPDKTAGLLKDLKTPTEDGLMINHLWKHDQESYDIYLNATVKPILKGGTNKTLLDREKGNLRLIQSEEYYLGN